MDPFLQVNHEFRTALMFYTSAIAYNHPLFVHLNDRLLGSKGHLGGGGMSITRWRLFSCSRVDYSIHPMELFTDPSGSAETLKLLVSTATRNNYVLYATANTLQSKIAC